MDWRIGLKVTPKLGTHPLLPLRGEILRVEPSGYEGLNDKDGILVIAMDAFDMVVVDLADNWVTAEPVVIDPK